MYISSSSPILVNCVFTDNSADTKEGGGMCTSGSSSPTLTNCIFSGNSANSGGGMYNFNYSSPTLVNCTFNGNLAVNYGGGIYDSNGSPTLANCILWGNTATTGPQIHNVGSSHPVVSFSDVQGGYSGTSNINADPLFVNAGDNLRLSPGSPCIDTANNLAVPTGIETDLDGRDRFVDGDCNTTVIVDMGAFEFTSAYFGDFDSDCDVDFLDYAIQAQLWLTDEFLADIAPTPAGDGLVDTSDLAVLCDNWLYGVDE
jgi:parallel beta-helix repeat protein